MKLRASGAITDVELEELMEKDKHFHSNLSPSSSLSLLAGASSSEGAQQDPRIQTHRFEGFGGVD